MIANIQFKPTHLLVFLSFLLLAVAFPIDVNAQDLDFIADEPCTIISSSSCEEGGEIWVCGSDQLRQAHGDFHTNCSEWQYRCGRTLKTILDVCAPEIVRSTISSPDC